MTSQFGDQSKILPVGLISLVLAGCGNTTNVDSETVLTSSIWAGMELTSKGDGRTGIKVELNERTRFGPNVQLSANERLQVDAQGLITTLQEDIDIFDIDYEGTINTDAANTLFRVSLFRADGTINNGSTINIPTPFRMTLPSPNPSVRVGDVLAVRWSPANPGREITLTFVTLCSTQGATTASRRDFDIDDSGAIDFDTTPLADIVSLSACDLTISLDRFSAGTLDPAFRGGGSIRAVQTREVEGRILR